MDQSFKQEQRDYITKQNGTEPAFLNAYWDHYAPGLYVDPYTGQVLFASIHKYDSGSGWPSFYKAVHHNALEFLEDYSLGMKRTEVRSRSSNSHLGHVFDDGFLPSGKRYCINSAALDFVGAKTARETLPRYAALFVENPQNPKENILVTGLEEAEPLFATAIFAGGCFWCTEATFEKQEGVMKVLSGYTGGTVPNPSYREVCRGTTGHYEAVLILYQPAVIAYQTLLDIFWRQIDPTDNGGQFYDRGSQYRTAIFYRGENERMLAEQSKNNLSKQKIFGEQPIVSEILPEQTFYLAEDEHQDYFVKETLKYQNYVKASKRGDFLQSIWNK